MIRRCVMEESAFDQWSSRQGSAFDAGHSQQKTQPVPITADQGLDVHAYIRVPRKLDFVAESAGIPMNPVIDGRLRPFPLLVDVGRRKFSRIGHLPGARHRGLALGCSDIFVTSRANVTAHKCI